MVSTIYTVGFIISFASHLTRLSYSVIEVKRTERVLIAFFQSVFWFISIPFAILTGDFFKKQREIDKELYQKHAEEEVDKVIEQISKQRKIEGDELKELRQSILEEMGTLEDMLQDKSYFSVSVSTKELAGLIAYRYYKKNRVPYKYKLDGPKQFVLEHVDTLLSLTSMIKNSGLNHGELKSTCVGENHPLSDLLGFQTLSTGLAFLGALSEGEHPFFFIVYYDGEDLQIYVPKHNTYNRETELPFGDDVEDEKFMKTVNILNDLRRAKEEYGKKINADLTLSDIKNTINFIPKKGNLPKFGWKDICFESQEG